jgi:ribonuclease HI
MGKEIKKFYAVKKGLKPGIYFSWNECKAQTHKFKGAIFKSFPTLKEAEDYLNSSEEKDNSSQFNSPEPKILNPSYAYIDGSFNKQTKVYGYGGFIMHNNEKYIIQGCGNDPEMATMRNVAGEIIASQETIKKAIELGIKNIDIFYDYSGIEKWATGEYKRNKEGTKSYYEFIQSIKSQININFIKVKGHSGNEGNDEADRIAKEAAGIKYSNDESFYCIKENEDKILEPETDKKYCNISLAKLKHIKKKENRKNENKKIETPKDKLELLKEKI